MPSDELSRSGNSPVGRETMSPAMTEMRAYCRYLLSAVAPGLGARVWEVGAGHGTYTALLSESGRHVLATDVDPDCLRDLAEQFRGDPGVETAQIDLTDQASVRRHSAWEADSIICFNVIEHIEDDVAALRWLRESVAPGTSLGVIVPAHPSLFGRMDAEAGHFRRYTRQSLRDVFIRAGWIVERLRYINLAGAFGWWYHNRFRRDAGLADERVNRQMLSADRWLPRFGRLTDPFFRRICGLSVLGIGRAANVSGQGSPSPPPGSSD